MDSEEFSQHLARHLYIEPIGQPWRQVAQLCAVVRGMLGKGPPPQKFLPVLKLDDPMPLGDMKTLLKDFAKQYNERVK